VCDHPTPTPLKREEKNMPRAYPHSHLTNGSLVGFSVKQRDDGSTYFVYFRGLDGRRLERDTAQTGVIRAVDAAKAIIEREYAPPPCNIDNISWDETIGRLTARLKTSGNRPGTHGYYIKLIRMVQAAYSSTAGPAEITPAMAAAWRDKLMSTPGKWKKPLSAHYVAGLIEGMVSLWQKWFVDDLKIVSANPWADIAVPKRDKLTIKIVSDEQISHFLGWTDERFSGWKLPRVFFAVKTLTGCRLMDLCSLCSTQLQGGRLVFSADEQKGRKERRVPIPPDLYAALEATKGVTYLWESHPEGLKAALKKKGWPTHQINGDFAPKRLYFWVESLFADYHSDNPDRPRITSHMFRKRAFTAAWAAKIDARRAALAIGCNVDTMMKHYVQCDEQAVTDEVFAELTPRLAPKGRKATPNGKKKKDSGK
jgi:integrase